MAELPHKKILLVAIALVLAIVNQGFGEFRNVSGYGITPKEAVLNGLIEAIRQVKGVEVEVEEKLKSNFSETTNSNDGVREDRLVLKEQQSSDIFSKTNGAISSYKVLSVHKSSEGLGHEAHLEVKIPDYEMVGLSPENRRRLAVMPFRTNGQTYIFEDILVSPNEASRKVTQGLVTQFTQSRRFAVLDREFVEEFMAEKNIIISPDAPIEEQAKLGNVLGVDYMVVGTVNDAGYERYVGELKLTGQIQPGWYTHATVDYRIILMATRQVKWANTVRIEMSSQDTPELGQYGDPQQVRDALFEKVAQKIAEETLSNIYPVLVVSSLGNGTYVLNQGGAGIKIGELFDVFAHGKKIIDPYTKESLGYTEDWIALLEVIRVTPKLTYAQLIEGDPSNLTDGSICRKNTTEMEQRSVHAPNTTGMNKGVKLPFD
ncbi:MAG: CsgG/HfaB family protein [Desulfuromonas sp.]|nr:CsgG/HfaB family protein [Desulfuromonas sp.]